MTGDHEPIRLVRQAVRVLPIDPAGRVLLLQCVRPGAPDEPFWVTVGGGIEAGESEREAAVRELWEETGIHARPAALQGPVGAETVEFSWPPYAIEQHQAYYLVEVEDTAVTFAHLEEVEIATTRDHRWWVPDDLRNTTEHVLDNQQVIIERALANRYRSDGS